MAASNSDSDFESPPVRSSSKKSIVGNLSWTRKKQLARKKTKLPPRIAKTSMNADVSSSLVSWFIFNKYFKSVNVICLCYLFHNHFWLMFFVFIWMHVDFYLFRLQMFLLVWLLFLFWFLLSLMGNGFVILFSGFCFICLFVCLGKLLYLPFDCILHFFHFDWFLQFLVLFFFPWLCS